LERQPVLSSSNPAPPGLLDRLRQGDEAAVAEVFRTYEPYLRLVVHRHLAPALRPKLDSQDVVQSVWVQLIKDFRRGGWCFNSAGHLQAFLTRATRNRLIDRLRRHRVALEQECPLERSDEERLPSSSQPRPSQLVQEQEAWQKIQAHCSPGQMEIVQLRQQGLTINEIAARKGMHPSSVRRILYDLAWHLGVARKKEPQ
jgi:RNA polymerase sigma-70 factor (ECF subfamily)